jgi:hypothetical protein
MLLYSFAIFLLILKPIMLLILNKIRQDRLNNAVFDSWGKSYIIIFNIILFIFYDSNNIRLCASRWTVIN